MKDLDLLLIGIVFLFALIIICLIVCSIAVIMVTKGAEKHMRDEMDNTFNDKEKEA